MICAGIDAGSRTLKVVLVDADLLGPVAWGVVDQGIDQDRLALDLLEKLLREQGLRREDVGAGGFHRIRPQTRAHGRQHRHGDHLPGRGVRYRVPGARTIVDIGGQDSKLVRLKENGAVAHFPHERPLRGRHRAFLDMLAAQLGTPFCELESLVGRSLRPWGRDQQHVRRICRKRDCWALGRGRVGQRISSRASQTAIATRIAAMTGRNLAELIRFTGESHWCRAWATCLRPCWERPASIAPQPQATFAPACGPLGRGSSQKKG